MKKSIWSTILKLIVTILTAVATTLGVGAVLPKGEAKVQSTPSHTTAISASDVECLEDVCI